MDTPNAPGPQPGWFTKLSFKIAGVDEELIRQCAQRDADIAMDLARLLIASTLYQALIFTLESHNLWAARDEIRPSLILVSVGLAIFIAQIDSFVIMKSGWYREGAAQLKQGGIDMSGGTLAQIKALGFLVVRIGVLSAGLAMLSGLFLSLFVFGGDINARVEKQWRADNASLVASATIQVNSRIERVTIETAHQTSVVEKLSSQIAALRTGEIAPELAFEQVQREGAQLLERKAKAEDDLARAELFSSNELGGVRGTPGNSGRAGNGPRRRAALEQVDNERRRIQDLTNALNTNRARLENLQREKPVDSDANRLRVRDQHVAFEETLKAENAKLADLKDELNKLVSNREKALHTAVADAPNHVRRDDGLLAQIRILGQIADENPRMAVVIVVVDLVSFGFELAAVLAKVLGHVPTGYAVLLAYTSYMEGVRIVERMLAELKAIDDQRPNPNENMSGAKPAEGEHDPGEASATNPFESSNGVTPVPPVKRGPGRPRKPRPAPPTNANGHDHGPEEGPEK
jgi:hypothetical protein